MSLLTLQLSQTAVGHLQVRLIITRKGDDRALSAAEGASQLNETMNGHFWPLALSVIFMLFRPDLCTLEPLEPSVSLFVLSLLDSSSFSSSAVLGLTAPIIDVAKKHRRSPKSRTFVLRRCRPHAEPEKQNWLQ